MCQAPATSREHVPPKVFFPERKDMPGHYPDFRTDPITVPSCDNHNLNKSWNDEYSFMIIVASFEVSSIAQLHFGKVIRALHYKPKKGRIYIKDFTPITIDDKPSIAPHVQIDRFISFFDQVSRGLYFHHNKKHWNKNIQVLPLSLYRSPEHKNYQKINQMITDIRKTTKSYFQKELKLGAHPEIFYYQFHIDLETSKLLLRMVFYEGFEILTREII